MVTETQSCTLSLLKLCKNPTQPVTVSWPNENITVRIPQHLPSYKREHDHVNPFARKQISEDRSQLANNNNVRANNNFQWQVDRYPCFLIMKTIIPIVLDVSYQRIASVTHQNKNINRSSVICDTNSTSICNVFPVGKINI